MSLPACDLHLSIGGAEGVREMFLMKELSEIYWFLMFQ